MVGTTGQTARRGAVLIVDDSGYARLHLRRSLVELGFTRVVEACNGDEALEDFSRHNPTLVLMDQVMRGREGIETARLMLAENPLVKIVMLTIVNDRELQQKALAIGVRKVVQKTDQEALAAVLHEVLHEIENE